MEKSFIRKFTNGFMAWCAENSPAAKFERAVFQSALGLLSSWLSSIAGAPEWLQVAIIPFVVSVMTLMQAAAGENYAKKED